MRNFLLALFLVSAPAHAEVYGVQVGAFKEFDRAENVQEALEDAGFSSYFSEADGYKRVRIGPFTRKSEAEAAANELWPFLVARFGPLEFQRSWVITEDRQIENAPIRPEPRIFALRPAPLSFDGDSRAACMIEDALQFRGVRYRWGGTSPEGFDCSGFVQHIFARAGFSIPRQAKNQFKVGEIIQDNELAPGDLVFFSTYSRGASHVGIYMGNGEFVHSSSGEGSVTITPLSKRYYANRYLGARRIIDFEPEIVKQMSDLVNR